MIKVNIAKVNQPLNVIIFQMSSLPHITVYHCIILIKLVIVIGNCVNFISFSLPKSDHIKWLPLYSNTLIFLCTITIKE